MRELISLQAIGLSPIEAVRYYLALKMAERGLVSAPNAAAEPAATAFQRLTLPAAHTPDKAAACGSMDDLISP